MRKIIALATLLLGALSGQAQEKVMNIQKTDGTNAQTRIADLKQISFLHVLLELVNDPNDERNKEASRKLLEVEARMKAKR